MIIWVFPKIGVPQIINFNRVFHYFHHPFWVPLFVETPIYVFICLYMCFPKLGILKGGRIALFACSELKMRHKMRGLVTESLGKATCQCNL